MLADYDSDSEDRQSNGGADKSNQGQQVMKIGKFDIELDSKAEKLQAKAEPEKNYRDMPSVGLGLAKRKPEHERYRDEQERQTEAGLNETGLIIRSELSEVEKLEAKKSLVPNQLKMKRKNKPIEI